MNLQRILIIIHFVPTKRFMKYNLSVVRDEAIHIVFVSSPNNGHHNVFNYTKYFVQILPFLLYLQYNEIAFVSVYNCRT